MLKELKKELKKSANPAKARILQRFFKTGPGQYGEGDIFYGIVLPVQRLIVKKYSDGTSLIELDALIRSRIHEERLVALLILVRKFQQTDDKKLQQEIYEFYLSHTDLINNWDLVDLSAPKIVGAYLRDKPKAILYKLARSKKLWERRISILSTFDDIYNGKPDDALKISAMLMGDKHDLIHKACGWMLREVGKRCNEKYLTDFLDAHAYHMPRTMLRYAIERLPQSKKARYMRMKTKAAT